MTIHQLHSRTSHPLHGVTWQEQLDGCASEREVVAVVRDFVATLSPDDIAALPERCRPGKFVGADDVTAFAFDVVRHHCDGDSRMADLVHRLATFFSHASIRLSQLMAHPEPAEDDERRRA